MRASEVFAQIKGGLIVSCQAEEGDPFNSPEGVTMFAKAAKAGGAAAIRSRDIDKTTAIVQAIGLPVIGLTKSKFPDGSVRITGSFREVEAILSTGIDIVTIDGTARLRDGLSGHDFIKEVKKRYNCAVMADIATLEEALACYDCGVDCVSTTLSGYTPETLHLKTEEPDFKLVEALLNSRISCPIIAEGRINTPQFAQKMISLGVHAIVVGTAITRPRIVTSWFADAIKQNVKQ